ncbi:SMC-Scp complex subunit ScpB [Kangiella sp. HZ709]|uniref:SMC-Scp complex subunit ScpB n=1 Tax=Kangiella sp. HZ709 TaxID=2666328 RepID=UPI0012AFF873|nr:SMC-Scp complex subunit ScpB [Kangiella sp. HZ709]MRX28362.1 SMC-Scp complex subunit ScpB [Kangiella sp. HZ709]
MQQEKIIRIIEAALLAAGSTLNKDRMLELFTEDEKVKPADIKKAIQSLQQEAEGRGIELIEVSTGYRYQARQDYAEWIARLWEERPARYSRALLETLSLIAYRQPATRGDVEQVRGVSVSSNIIKTLLEREWVRVVGHRDVPGKPALYATTKQFLDYFGLKSLDELPSLAEIQDLDNLNPELKFDQDDKQTEHLDESQSTTVLEQDTESETAQGEVETEIAFEKSDLDDSEELTEEQKDLEEEIALRSDD